VFVSGLGQLSSTTIQPLPHTLGELFGYPHAHGAALVVGVAEMLHSNRAWTLLEALGELDRRFLAAAVAAVRRGRLESCVLLANDRQWRVRRSDFVKRWRPARRGLDGLQ
jgi:hypothetical protein